MNTSTVVFAGTILALAGSATAEDLSGAAYSTCQMFALDRLTRPATARFPALGEPGTLARVPAPQRPGQYEIESYCDFRGEAGERIRHRVYCDLRLLGRNRWQLDRILMGTGERPALEREEAARRAEAKASRRRRELAEWVAREFEKDDTCDPSSSRARRDTRGPMCSRPKR